MCAFDTQNVSKPVFNAVQSANACEYVSKEIKRAAHAGDQTI